MVDSNVRGMAIGEMPYMSLNGVLVWSACQRLLLVNLSAGSILAHVSGCVEQ